LPRACSEPFRDAVAYLLILSWAGAATVSCDFPEYHTPAFVAGATAEGGSPTNGGSDAGALACKAEPCLVCPPGTADCNESPEDGCETSLETASNCGDCGVACSNEHGANTCEVDSDSSTARCEPTCAAGHDDCDLRPDNGCETGLNGDVLNCGSCGHACPASGGIPACVAGTCGVSGCNPGLGDCRNAGACTFSLWTDPQNCGQCGYVCSAAHGTPRCNAGVCETDCDAGYGDCNANARNDGCETTLNVPDTEGSVPNCGACGALCKRRAYTTIDRQKCALVVCRRDCFHGAHDCTENRNDPTCLGQTCGCEFDPCP
jgi:hypothetical protein